MANKFFKKPKNVAIQLLNLKSKYECLDCNLGVGKLFWKQRVRPSDLSRTYDITVKYNGMTPEVYLYNQGIMTKEDEYIPHCYRRHYKNKEDEYVKLCLYYPGYQEWSRDMFLSDTIIPWTIDWLYFYELWRVTGKWLGGGIEHEKNKKDMLSN